MILVDTFHNKIDKYMYVRYILPCCLPEMVQTPAALSSHSAIKPEITIHTSVL